MFLRPSASRAAIRSVVASARLTELSSNERAAILGRRLLSSSITTSRFRVSRHQSMASRSLNDGVRWFSSKSGEEERKEEADTTTTKEPPPENTPADAETVASASKEDELNAQIKDLKDQLLRSYAEQENIRQIARNDVQAANSFAIRKFAKSLLDVADNLDRALEAVGEDQQKSPEFQSFFQGIELTKSGLVKALQSNGVTPYCEEPGDLFNPEHHEALMEYPDPTATPGTVGQVIKKGYMLNGRVLRPAEVGVVKK
ncbi:ribulose-phosphate 3-epimerase [Nitzschia inconspicua]|uniref:Ribulose-phosphate 3-epimerase n=1 Tax=Nitzschia inconspicua TaxID=303405 RepID=A0A9K3LJ95_9STRA|nr:ribulose-phosphate 3-epimerase [Nitzschia inconspicua]